jgi:hypothetical protein
MMRELANATVRHARRVVVTVVGVTVLLIGVALLVLPGPAVVVIPIGLAILGLEFAWARRLLRRAREEIVRRTGTDPHPGRWVPGLRRNGAGQPPSSDASQSSSEPSGIPSNRKVDR